MTLADTPGGGFQELSLARPRRDSSDAVLSGRLLTCRRGPEVLLGAGFPSAAAWLWDMIRPLPPCLCLGPRPLFPQPWAAAGARSGFGELARLLAVAAAGSSRFHMPHPRWSRQRHIWHALLWYTLQSASGLAAQRAWRLVAVPGTAMCWLAAARQWWWPLVLSA